MEALFAVGRATAFCLLAQFGPQINADGVLQAHRRDLLTQLEAVPQCETYQAWAGGRWQTAVVAGRVLFAFTFPEEFWALVDEFANLCAQDRAGFEGAVTV